MTFRTEIRESAIEKTFKQKVEAIGAKVRKYTSPGHAGVADRIVFWKGRAVLVELKRPSTDLESLQEYEKEQMEVVGIITVRIRDTSEIDGFIAMLRRGEYWTRHNR